MKKRLTCYWSLQVINGTRRLIFQLPDYRWRVAVARYPHGPLCRCAKLCGKLRGGLRFDIPRDSGTIHMGHVDMAEMGTWDM